MAKTIVNSSMYFGGVALPSYTNEIDFAMAATAVDFTNFASGGWKEIKGGILSSEVMVNGYWDGAEPDATLFGSIGVTGTPFSATTTYPAVDGDIAYFMNVLGSKYGIANKIGEAAAFSLALGSTAPVARGKVIDARTATATGNGTALQLGAVLSTQRLYYAVHVFGVTGTNPTLDLVIQSDNAGGFGSAATVATLAQFIAAGSIYGTVDGPITDDYFRIARTVGGTDTPTFQYIFFIAIGPKP